VHEPYRQRIATAFGLQLHDVATLEADDFSALRLLQYLEARVTDENRDEYLYRSLTSGLSVRETLLKSGVDAAWLALFLERSARDGPFNAITENGRIDVCRLAHELGTEVPVLARALHLKRRLLKRTPDAREAQKDALLLLASLNELADAIGGAEHVRWWLNTPQPEFGGETPLDCLKTGHLDIVVSLAHDIAFLTPD
jgi:Protein of unknown function (DUF2384)